MSRRVADVLQDVAALEILQAPGLTFSIPDMFAGQPRLTGAPPGTRRTSLAPRCVVSQNLLALPAAAVSSHASLAQ